MPQFKQKGFPVAKTQLDNVIEQLTQVIQNNKIVTPQVARTALSLESATESSIHALQSVSDELSTAMESIAHEMGIDKNLTSAQIEAGSIAGIVAGDYRAHLSHKTAVQSVSTEGISVVQNFNAGDVLSERSYSLEAYDERENKNAVIYSIAYNMQAAKQDEFGETFFPTIVVTPDNVGFGVTVNLMTVYDAIERKVSGSFTDFNKKNIIRAVANPDILKKEQTRIVPVFRAQSADKFVAAAVVPDHAVILEGESINTAPLAVGKEIDLLGISQTDTLLSAGIMDMTDSIDPSVTLKNVYVKVGDDVLVIGTMNLPLSNFTYSTQNNYRVMTLNFATTSVLVNKNTKNVDGSALVTLASVVTNDLIVRLKLVMTGSVNIETGHCEVFGNAVSVNSVQNNAGEVLDLTAAPAAGVVTAFTTAAIAGYDLIAYRANMNRRQRGQLIDTTKYTQLYNVPLRSPITALHPINSDDQTDNSDVQALITGTRIRTCNESVTSLLSVASQLREYVDARDTTGVGPDILGVGRFFVKPTYLEKTIDMNDIVDSIKSHERAKDIQEALVSQIRDAAYNMYRDSEYKAAADALAGGTAPVPVVIIGTDPVLARYLTVSGDLRTLGGEFDVRIVHTLDYRMQGKICITFGTFDESRNVAPNPLNFGNMVWSPEIVLTANISRGGSISKETVVQPRYLFVTHLPVLTVLVINNVPDVINKVPVNFHSV